jgi:hypothetical protein
LGRGKIGLGGTLGIHFVLGFKLGDDLVGLDLIADRYQTFDHPAFDAKSETGFVARGFVR